MGNNSLSKRAKSKAALVVACMMLCPLALTKPATAASQFMNINFSGDTAGTAPATNSTPTGPVTEPTALGGYDNDSDPNGFGDSPPKADEGTVIVNDAGTMSKAAVMTSTSGNDNQGAIWMDTDYGVTANNFQLSFDIDVLNGLSNSTVQTKKLNGPTGPDTEMVFGINQFSADGTVVGFAAAPTSSGGGVFALRSFDNSEIDSFFNYTNGSTYHIDLVGDYSTGTVDAYVNGILEDASYPMRAGLTSNDLNETFAFVNGDPGGSNSVALDNLSLSVPEPASIGMLAVGGLMMMSRRRRASR